MIHSLSKTYLDHLDFRQETISTTINLHPYKCTFDVQFSFTILPISLFYNDNFFLIIRTVFYY